MAYEDHLTTEARNPASEAIDALDARGIVSLMHAEDLRAVAAVGEVLDVVAQVVDEAAERFRKGGRLLYFGAGTSGRLGILDASECPPTFNSPPSMVVGRIAGGLTALTTAVEGAEDNREAGAHDVRELNANANDLVVGIATSGRTPYVIGALAEAKLRGAATVGIACNRPSQLDDVSDVMIAPLVGPEVLAGSTRLKAGTATKLVLNMITTGAMIRLGKTYGNRLVDLQPTNEKLRIRTRRILRELAGIDDPTAEAILHRCGGKLKPSLVVALAGVEPDQAETLLQEHGGQVRDAVKAVLGAQPR